MLKLFLRVSFSHFKVIKPTDFLTVVSLQGMFFAAGFTLRWWHMELWNMEFNSLKRLHDKELSRLNQLLLQGASWEETTPLRRKVIELSTIIYKRQHPHHFNNPAEYNNREH